MNNNNNNNKSLTEQLEEIEKRIEENQRLEGFFNNNNEMGTLQYLKSEKERIQELIKQYQAERQAKAEAARKAAVAPEFLIKRVENSQTVAELYAGLI